MRTGLVMAAALAVGIAAADWLRPHPALVLVALLLCGFWAVVGSPRTLVPFLAILALFGGFRHAFDQTAGRGNLAAWEGERVTLVGTVVGEPEVRLGGVVAYVLEVERVGEERAQGKVYVAQRSGSPPGFGERVSLEGRLDRPDGPRTPGGFDQAAYLGRKGVYLTVDTGPVERMGPGRLDPLRRTAVAVRIRLEGVVRAALPSREAALMSGLLFGTRSELPEDIKESFRAAGVFHLLAVSGGNVAMLVVPLLAGLQFLRLGKRAASGVAIGVVIFFVFLTGASPSVMRAGLMAVLVLLGDMLGRERDALNTLGIAALLLLVHSPALLFDLGFQLSVVATLGIMLYARRIQERLTPPFLRLFGPHLGTWLAGGLSVTFAAQVMVEPLSLHQFGMFSAIAPLANLLVVLVVGWLVPAGMAIVLLGAFWPPVTLLLRVGGGIGLAFLIYAVKAVATLPFASIELGRLPLVWVVAWYASLAILTLPRLRHAVSARVTAFGTDWRGAAVGHRLAVGGTLLGLAATALTWRLALAQPADQLVVTFLDVGQGDATLIQVPGGRTLLIDAGQAYPPDPRRGRPGYDAGAQVVVPYLQAMGVKRLDTLVLSHPDGDHVGGAPAVLRAVPVGDLWLYNPTAPERGQVEALAFARLNRLPVREPVEGERVQLASEVWLELLGAPKQPFQGTRSDDNANCIAMRLVYRRVAVLLACDLEAVAEERLAESGVELRADLLKVSHHGSGHSSTGAFLDAVAPTYALISAGNGNPFGHPNQGALERIGQRGAEIWRTDRHGTITLRTDGFSLHLEGTRGSPQRDEYRPLGLLGRRILGAW